MKVRIKMVMVVVVAILFVAEAWADEKPKLPARCTENYCNDLLELSCPDLPSNCTAGKFDFFGWMTLSTDPCNCCPYCVAYLGDGNVCPIGQATGIAPTHMCGPGLYCYSPDPKNVIAECKTMVDVVKLTTSTTKPALTPQFIMDCSKDQLTYDLNIEKGLVGNLQLRPECDENGLYATYKCIPGEICFCQDEFGSRIFGEISFTPLAAELLHCGCSRHNAKAVRNLQDFGNTWSQMRCLPDGSFDPIQCLEEGCFCVDILDGTPTYREQEFVNPTAIEQEAMPCFDNKTHTEFDYYRVCEDSFNRNYVDDMTHRLEGYDTYGAVYSKCQMDGRFARVQFKENLVYCADPEGNQIENYGIARRSQVAIDRMNCNCARANLLISGLEKPECCPNGSYKSMQCRRGECRCVDENGYQVEKEVPMDDAQMLSCYSNLCL